MQSSERNPWEVENVEDFLYFCCPECDVKNHSRDHFLKHAFDQHPKSKEYLEKLAVKKEEMNDSQKDEEEEDDQKFIQDNEFEESMKEEKLDEESDDPHMYLNSNYIK